MSGTICITNKNVCQVAGRACCSKAQSHEQHELMPCTEMAGCFARDFSSADFLTLAVVTQKDEDWIETDTASECRQNDHIHGLLVPQCKSVLLRQMGVTG